MARTKEVKKAGKAPVQAQQKRRVDSIALQVACMLQRLIQCMSTLPAPARSGPLLSFGIRRKREEHSRPTPVSAGKVGNKRVLACCCRWRRLPFAGHHTPPAVLPAEKLRY